MCSIHGIIDLRGHPADGRPLAAMAKATVHRGPDDEEAGGDNPANRMMVVGLLTELPDDLLLTDKMTMAASLECRVPLLDHELVELSARLPENAKIGGGELKHILKRALGGVLPAEVLTHRKRGFGAPMGAWIRSELSGALKHVLNRASLERRGLFDFGAVQRLTSAHDQMRIDGTDRLLALLNFEVWARVFLDHRSPEDVASELRASAA